jgi:hypothetical protein
MGTKTLPDTIQRRKTKSLILAKKKRVADTFFFAYDLRFSNFHHDEKFPIYI